MDRLDFNR